MVTGTAAPAPQLHSLGLESCLSTARPQSSPRCLMRGPSAHNRPAAPVIGPGFGVTPETP